MLNFIILALLWAALGVSVICTAAEMICRRNSGIYRFFRTIWIRLRELSLMRVCVTSLLLLFWGLASGDDNFYGIWQAILLMLTMNIILRPDDIFSFRKRRKKARRSKKICSMTKILKKELPETPLAAASTALAPLSPESPAE